MKAEKYTNNQQIKSNDQQRINKQKEIKTSEKQNI